MQRSRPWRGTEVSNDKNPPKKKFKKSWNWLVIRMATSFWHILKIKRLQWLETEIKWICWNLIWKIREITVGNFFWRVLVIWNLCAVATVILPMSCTETFGQLLQLIGTIQGGAKDFLKLHWGYGLFEIGFDFHNPWFKMVVLMNYLLTLNFVCQWNWHFFCPSFIKK